MIHQSNNSFTISETLTVANAINSQNTIGNKITVMFECGARNRIQSFCDYLRIFSTYRIDSKTKTITVTNYASVIGSIFKGLGFPKDNYIPIKYVVRHSKFAHTPYRDNLSLRYIVFNTKTKEIKYSTNAPFVVNGLTRGTGTNSHFLINKINNY